MLTLVLADPAPVVRGGLRALLASHDDIAVVAEAATGRDVVIETLRHRPDVLLVDLERRDLIATCNEVRRAAPGTAVLVFTDTNDDTAVMAAVRAGVMGYLPKTSTERDLVRAVYNIAAGQAVYGPHVAATITGFLLVQPPTVVDVLTPREREVLELLVCGLQVSAIARRLALASKTVRNHTSAIFAKLGVTSRGEAVGIARRAGIDRLVCQ